MCPNAFAFAAVAVAALWVPGSVQAGPLPDEGTVDYQLGGGYPPPPGVTIIVRDSTDKPEPGLFNICYVNGFQTQPGEVWPKALLVPGPDGQPLVDPGWPDEFLLDVSTERSRELNLTRIEPSIQVCARKGFDAVEFDNLDSYTRSRGHLNRTDALVFAKLLVATARKYGLTAGQKNASELGTEGRDEAGFSFAIVEECDRWRECDAYTSVYGATQVIYIEYADDLRIDFATACAQPQRPRKMIIRDRMLLPAGSADQDFRTCD
ncbi:endo alpha-1,4 polygalactosaminidase [Peteryoungia ipomoeae]|uniref:Glycoside-hydrolase family GH114 TIM-barrel domain-containing protein n=1 Tax=Peteryoungia ipomoeae TaxID=1210932 RepID=A0A4S8NR99_9HYPH|nr:endo alpha-1,4 polygalactosaminidase [Peteryoungia ipomoeae]THV19757.1 hypothetical protein FAA97_20575 [Peteryoungia ipomoeae]